MLNKKKSVAEFDLTVAKAELPQEGILFRTQFPSLGFFY
jgi:hypothetical protein